MIQFHLIVTMMEMGYSGPHQDYLPRMLPPVEAAPATDGPPITSDWPELRQGDEYPPTSLQASPVLYSSIWQSTQDRSILVEHRGYEVLPGRVSSPPRYSEVHTQALRELTRVLSAADGIQMHILKCRGIFFREGHGNHGNPVSTAKNADSRFELQFVLPPGYGTAEAPRTLRDLLVDPSNKDVRHPLDQRLRLAVNLAQAVLYVHSANFVHKNIRPENVLIISSDSQGSKHPFPEAIGEGFLVGFDLSRGANQPSLFMQNDHDLKSLYRHHERWGARPGTRFEMFHDVYSLGVVLLELGLWHPLARIDSTGSVRFGSYIKEYMQTRDAKGVQERLLKLARLRLAACMGSAYAEVVVACLRCVEDRLLDSDGDSGHDNGDSGRETTVGALFLSRVLQRLQDIHMVRV
ncbi:hypothetical protein FGG08_004508 [Glutinoglossum americanum]|uniref:Protein kinase domain-containing protein n=1 Tax=Glutinoglossum americanum TaxID=1670608 RepID=A0A9P8I551_9PEZI|nr:hypothetical protein FGG08_004508 [Glutinoglossum americanum]